MKISNSIESKFDFSKNQNRINRTINFGNKKISKVGGATLEIRIFFQYSKYVSNIRIYPCRPYFGQNTRQLGDHRSMMKMLGDGGFDFWGDDLWGDDDDGTSAEEDEYIRRMWEDEDEEEEELMERNRKRRNCGRRPGGTNRSGRPHYWESTWGVMLRDPELQTIGSDARKTFMRRFRVPHSIFTRLVDWTKGWHEKHATDAAGRPRCPTELKVLGWLRMVGRGVCFDDLEELSCIKSPTMHTFFHEFNRRCREELYPIHVRMPSNIEELMEIEAAYAAVGIPGACGSMDVVHIPLGACPHGLINVCTGKEGYPTLAYNVICDHSGRALALMPGAYGTINDKTIVKSDEAVEEVKTGDLFKKFRYQVYRPDGTSFFTTGAYLIVDGGYLRWKCLQCGLKHSSDEDYVLWRRRMESVRKDIECYFGRLKQRFKALRTPNLLKDKVKIDNMMFSIVAVQNMILEYTIAAEEMRSWSVQFKWQSCDLQNQESPETLLQHLHTADQEDEQEEDDHRWYLPVVKKKARRKGNWAETNEYYEREVDLSEIGLRGNLNPADFGWEEQEVPDSKKEGFTVRQNILVNHFKWFRQHLPSGYWLRS